MPKSKKQRVSRTSSGNGIRHIKSPQTPIQLILLNKGAMVNVKRRWAGK